MRANRTDPTVAALLKATFPEYNGRRIVVTVADTVQFYGTQWDGGCKREYKIVNLATMQNIPIVEAPFLQRSALHEARHTIADGFAIVVMSYCRSNYVEIIANSSAINPMLSAPVELTDDEKTVLVATRGLKSSYAGISDYRFHQARQKRGITRERWDLAKNNLIGRKLLNKAGAITVEGRNVCPDDYI